MVTNIRYVFTVIAVIMVFTVFIVFTLFSEFTVFTVYAVFIVFTKFDVIHDDDNEYGEDMTKVLFPQVCCEGCLKRIHRLIDFIAFKW